jgi:hypothetical protein
MRCLLLACLTAALLAGAAGAAAPRAPRTGVVAPGKSFAGVKIGMTEAQVRAHWGSRFGVCDNCAEPTWYYTFVAFDPHGLGVRFRNKRVFSVFTLGAPRGWRTDRGLRIGDPAPRTVQLYGRAPIIDCPGYSLYQLLERGQLLLVYVSAGKVHGLGLAGRMLDPCSS